MSTQDAENISACIELGFIEKTESWKLRSKYFPSKVGGFPAWLALNQLPSTEEVSCKRCGMPLAFLCQVYAPRTDKNDCFHRTVFVFICRNADCSRENDSLNIRVFRSQLPRENKFYSFDPPKEEESSSESPLASDFCHLCSVCGCAGPKVCGGCKSVRYCSREHQALDWKGGHKAYCQSKENSTTKPHNCHATTSFLFPEYELVMEPEDLGDGAKEKSEEEVTKEYEELLRSGVVKDNDEDSDVEEDLARAACHETDKQFQRFRTHIKDDPEQVLRYDRGGEPLWVSTEHKPSDIPLCPACGEVRQFEFQIMPQLLVHLSVDSLGKSIDWGTILIYTCRNSCSQDTSYIEEVAFKQDYSPVGALLNHR